MRIAEVLFVKTVRCFSEFSMKTVFFEKKILIMTILLYSLLVIMFTDKVKFTSSGDTTNSNFRYFSSAANNIDSNFYWAECWLKTAIRAWQSGYIFKNYDRIPSRPTSTNSHRNCALIVCEKIQYENTRVRWWTWGGGGLEKRAYALTYNNRCCADRRRRRHHANRHRRFNLSAAITPGCTHIIIAHIVLTTLCYVLLG